MTNTIKWLLENSAPVIKYRVLKEICENVEPIVLQDALQDVLKLPETQKRLERIKKQDIYNVHGGQYEVFETSLPMVVDFGLTRGVGVLEQYLNIDKIIKAYETNINDYMIKVYTKVYIYPHFFRAGFYNKEVVDFYISRTEIIYDFINKMDFNIYVEESKLGYIPPNFRKTRVVKPELYDSNSHDLRLPQIYDILGLKELYAIASNEIQNKIDMIIKYIVSPEYNRFDVNYGILKINGRYKGIGWDCLLPNYTNKDIDNSLILQRMELFANFPVVIKSEWFKQSLQLLETFKTERETYIFPKEFLRERNNHWLLGNHNGLGENRNKKLAQELESTFWLLKIKSNARVI